MGGVRRVNRFNIIVLLVILCGLALYAGQRRRDQIVVERAKQRAAERVAKAKPQPSPSPTAQETPDPAPERAEPEPEPDPKPLSFGRRYKVCTHANLDRQPKRYAKKRKGSSEQLLIRGVAYHARHQYERALADFQSALDVDSGDPRLYSHIASLYDSMEDYEKALTFIEVAIEIDPRYYMAYGDRGWYHSKLGNSKQAQADWQTFLSVSPKKCHEYATSASEYRRRGELETALTLAEKTIQMDVRRGSYWTKGKILRDQGKAAAALATFQVGLKYNPWSVSLHEEVAELYQEMGQPGKAEPHLQEITRLKAEVLD